MKYLQEHYEKERRQYAEISELGAESFISYYRAKFPDKYKILLETEEKIEKVRQYSDNDRFLIQSGFVGNCMTWWAKNDRGYTSVLTSAHKYTKQEIIKKLQLGMRDSDKIWNCEHILDNVIYVCNGYGLNPKYRI